jgi:hypothetical protein
MYLCGCVNSWIICFSPDIMINTKCIWWQIFVEFLISWFDTINEIHEYLYAMNNNNSQYLHFIFL